MGPRSAGGLKCSPSEIKTVSVSASVMPILPHTGCSSVATCLPQCGKFAPSSASSMPRPSLVSLQCCNQVLADGELDYGVEGDDIVEPTRLYGTNKDVDRINNEKLACGSTNM